MTDPESKKRPDLTVYFVPDREKPFWTPIGAAWAHGDGEGFNLKLDLLPNGPGDIVLRKRKPKEAETASPDP